MWTFVPHTCAQAQDTQKVQLKEVKGLMIIWLPIKSLGKTMNAACQPMVFSGGCVITCSFLMLNHIERGNMDFI